MLTSGCASTGRGTLVGLHEAAAELLAASGGDGPRRAALIELDALRRGEVEQLLALLPLARRLPEQPPEEQDREDRALDHHDRAGDVLVLDSAHVPLRLAGRIARIEDRVRPHEHVAEHRADEPYGDDVDELGHVAEPGRLG